VRQVVSYAVLATALAFTLPAAAVQRTFVASYGSDANTANNCSFLNPCRGFQAAHGVTDAGGEVIAIDAAGYGAITITKSISLIANSGFYAGIAVGSGAGVTVNTAGVKVVLRGLNINGTGGDFGVQMNAGDALTIENCVFSNLATAAVNVMTPAKVTITNTIARDNYEAIVIAGGATASVSRVSLFGSQGAAIYAYSFSATTTTLSISDSEVSDNFLGIGARTDTNAGAAAIVSVTRTTASNNFIGVVTFADSGTGTPTLGLIDSKVTQNFGVGLWMNGGVLETLGGNFVRYNDTDTDGTITTVAPL